MKKIILQLIVLCYSLSTWAQSGATLSGQVLDNSEKPLELTSIALIRAKDNTLVKGTLTALDGSYGISKIPKGTYMLKATQVGYQLFQSSIIEIDDSRNNVVIPNIILKADPLTLSEVKIKSNKPFMNSVRIR